MSVTPPALPDMCWPVDWTCAEEFANDPANTELIAVAEALATQTLRMLTGYKVGGCPTVLRPCAARCSVGTTLLAPVSGRSQGAGPYISDGVWYNACGCSPSSCGCTSIQEIRLPGPVGSVTEVRIDGTVLSPSAYRVDNGVFLVRQDGLSWPTCQDFNAPAGSADTFTVSYVQGVAVDGVGAAVAGVLAYEYAKGMCGSDCALPPGVVGMIGGGVTMEIEPGSFPGGLTGILAVDAYVRFWNPYLAKAPGDVWSVDLPRGRRTTWGS